jgi:hypothetical protein
MCVYMHSLLVENHPIQILKNRPLISEVVLSQYVAALWEWGTLMAHVNSWRTEQVTKTLSVDWNGLSVC